MSGLSTKEEVIDAKKAKEYLEQSQNIMEKVQSLIKVNEHLVHCLDAKIDGALEQIKILNTPKWKILLLRVKTWLSR